MLLGHSLIRFATDSEIRRPGYTQELSPLPATSARGSGCSRAASTRVTQAGSAVERAGRAPAGTRPHTGAVWTSGLGVPRAKTSARVAGSLGDQIASTGL
ncbi:hypothetical protein R1flu_010814 [Riccia fluitans]|uniref:Uncharacterized protein n=1 Tax=Riccia fluitans TaxID=41844 RepID=A0ABD1Z627_9MARC